MSQTNHLTSHISHLTSIIVAGGTGSRMQSVTPKQFLPLNGKPVLMHTLEAFAASAAKPELIVVLHADFHEFWRELCARHDFTIPHQLISGGKTRFHSVKKGLEMIEAEEGLVAIHDAVRPLTSTTVIDAAYQQAELYGNAVVAVKSRDSIRRFDSVESIALPRNEIYLIQTPQTFKLSILRQAYEQPFDEHFTDDASVVEKAGYKIHLIEGDHTNIKITFPDDIAIAEAILNKKPSA